MVDVLRRAFRQAVRDRRTVVGSALVLRYGAVRVPDLYRLPSSGSRAWRHAHDLVDSDPPQQRSRLFADFDDQVRLFADGALREAAYHAGGGAAFSALLRHAVYEAVHEASRRDGVPAGAAHLLAAVFAAPGSAAATFANRWWADRWETGRPTHLINRQSPRYRAGDSPSDWARQTLTLASVLPSTVPRAVDLPWRAVTATVTYVMLRRPFRRYGARYGHPIPALIEGDAVRQAVRLGRTFTSTAEVLLSILDLHEQLDTAGAVLAPVVARHNTAGRILRDHGITLLAATRAAARLPDPSQQAPDPVATPTKGWPATSRTRRLAPPLDPAALSALRSASTAARHADAPITGTTHLLTGILSAADSPAAHLLRTLGADPTAIRADASRPPS